VLITCFLKEFEEFKMKVAFFSRAIKLSQKSGKQYFLQGASQASN
jgi:hypothetical protein